MKKIYIHHITLCHEQLSENSIRGKINIDFVLEKKNAKENYLPHEFVLQEDPLYSKVNGIACA